MISSITLPALCFFSWFSNVTMCFWRRVRNIYMRCNHVVRLPDEEIRCTLYNCKFSLAHPDECLACTSTCWQYHQSPQQYAPQIDARCPDCEASVPSPTSPTSPTPPQSASSPTYMSST